MSDGEKAEDARRRLRADVVADLKADIGARLDAIEGRLAALEGRVRKPTEEDVIDYG